MGAAYHSNIRHDIEPLIPAGGRVLDIGGGTGATVRHLRDTGRAQAVGVIDAVVSGHGADLDFWSDADLNDAAAIAAFLDANGPFDTVLLLDILEHLIDPWALVDLVARHVRPGGVMVASIPNVRFISVVADLVLRNRWTYADLGILDRTHLRFFVRESAIALMQRPGLSVVRVEPAPMNSPRHRLFNALSFGRLRSFFATQYFIVARRD